MLHKKEDVKFAEVFGEIEYMVVRFAVFIIFLVGLYQVVTDTLGKILK